MEKLSFPDVLITSWRLSFSRASFLLLGFFMALPIATTNLVLPAAETLDLNVFQATIGLHPLGALLFLLWYFLSTLYGKSNLITALDTDLRHTETSPRRPFSFLRSFHTFKKALFVDLVIAGFFDLFLFILSLPSLVSFLTWSVVPQALITIGIIAFVPVAIISFFIREFALFYFLLSPLRLKTAFEASTSFFIRYRFLCLFYGLSFVLIGTLFTFSFNLVMLPVVALLQKILPTIKETTLFFIGSLLYLAWYQIFWQALWLTFFHRLATPKETVSGEIVETVFKEKVSESPSA